jgi:hypothetical protein
MTSESYLGSPTRFELHRSEAQSEVSGKTVVSGRGKARIMANIGASDGGDG